MANSRDTINIAYRKRQERAEKAPNIIDRGNCSLHAGISHKAVGDQKVVCDNDATKNTLYKESPARSTVKTSLYWIVLTIIAKQGHIRTTGDLASCQRTFIAMLP